MGRRRVKVIAEALVEIADEGARSARRLPIEAAEFYVTGDDVSVDGVRALEREAVRGDPIAAVERLADPGAMAGAGVGIEFVESMHQVVEVDDDGLPVLSEPSFTELFPVCRCAGVAGCPARTVPDIR